MAAKSRPATVKMIFQVRNIYVANFSLLHIREREEMIAWCDLQFPDPEKWWTDFNAFCFKREEDYAWFLLRYGYLLNERKLSNFVRDEDC